MAQTILHIGNKNYSSWSLRPWLALKWGRIPFEERVVTLGGEGYGIGRIAAVRAVSPSGRVPALHVDGIIIHDSLAICEWAAEHARDLWPKDANTRALARSASAEMHSGFAGTRRDLSMNIRRRMQRAPDFPADTRNDLDRLFELWSGALERFGGSWLYGERSIADAMFAPVVTRLRTYAVKAPPMIETYCATLLADLDFRNWEAEAIAETWTFPPIDELYP